MEGLEPPHLSAPDPKSGVSTNFTTSAKVGCKYINTLLLTHHMLLINFGLTMDFFSASPQELSSMRMQHLLQGCIGPRPIAFASTVDDSGNVNLAPFSYFNVFSANPPIVVFSPARRGRDASTKHTLDNVKEVPEVVINIVSYSIVQQMSLASTEYERGVNEFVKAGLTPLNSEIVKPPRVAESPAQFECRVKEVVALGDGGGAGNLVICEVVRLHIRKELLDANGAVNQQEIDTVARMGGNWYCRAHGEALFEVPKPLTTLGVGVDALPYEVRTSKVLTGNDLGLLGNTEHLPDETEVNEYKLLELSDLFLKFEDDPIGLELALHERARQLIREGQINDALKTVLAFNN